MLTWLIDKNSWADVSSSLMTREGQIINCSDDVWNLPYSLRDDTSIRFAKIKCYALRWTVKKYIQERIQFTSSHDGFTTFTQLWFEILRHQNEFELFDPVTVEILQDSLIKLFEQAISKARSDHRFWALYRPVRWYLWCAENYPELGFCPAYAMELEGMVIPGNPKGEAVRLEDKEKGPLHRVLELPLLLDALRKDKSTKLLHLQQKAAIALSIALGRNPANLTYLKNSDFVNLSLDGQTPCHIIRMPRIKKRSLNPRDDLLDEYLDPEFARYVEELIHANNAVTTTFIEKGQTIEIEKPLFINVNKNRSALAAAAIKDIFNMTSLDITRLIVGFVRRHCIISPLTGESLQICTRRLRYTLATGLAAEGISRAELARILDHTDTQNVQVYFELAGTIVEHLDKAMAKGFLKYLQLFRGKVVENQNEAINGERDDKHLSFVSESDPLDHTEIGICGEKSLCHLDPPFSCYLCPKFQPYRHADHEYVMDCLLQAREVRIKKYEQARLGVQLDQVIFAVAQVVEQCKGNSHSE